MAEIAEAALTTAGNAALTEISKQAVSSVSSAARSVIIHLSNSSADILMNPQVYTYSGYCYGPPKPTVQQGITDVCTFGNVFTDLLTSDTWDSEHKPKTKRGAVGVLTYDIGERQKMKAVKRLAVMFSVPFNYMFYENWFALGLFNINQACDCALYKDMYYRKGTFTREKASGSEIRYQDRKYILKGTMSPMAKTEMKVELWDDETSFDKSD